ncbi:Metallo-dependent phosphatase-like protein [Phycomyces nitens]|nr:Metallo-dependent phosphatase-like protein [Phycomyces nitens]
MAQPETAAEGVYYTTRDPNDYYDLSEVPHQEKTRKQKRMWRLIAGGIALVIVIVVVVVAVVVTRKSKAGGSPSSVYELSPYANLIPIGPDASAQSLESKGRILVVGDVHGCVKEFDKLVEKLQLTSNDQLILAGDLTSKGPDSIGVLQRAKQLGALCVRGNHDDKVIRLKTFELKKGADSMAPPKAVMPEGNVGDPIKFSNYHSVLARNMSMDEYNYLSSCPMILNFPYLNNSVVVHAGLDPTITDLSSQVPYLVMNMRGIDNGLPTPENKLGTPWATLWNAAQANQSQPTRVFYGHASSRGLQINKYTFGVDTGCVDGGELTAIDMKTLQLTSVKCLKYDNDSE